MISENHFREEDLRKGHHFKLHIAADEENEKPHLPTIKHTTHQHAIHHEHQADKRDVREIIKDAGRQISASFIILVVGFLLLNWSAYYKIAKNEWQKFFGTKELSPLVQIVEGNTVVYGQENVETSTDPYIQKKQIPGMNMEISPSDDRLIISRIDQNIPIVKISSESLIKRDWDGLEKEMQTALKDGVVHYPGTSLPGQTGNVVITGHSSYFPWDPGRFKDVFALLHDVVEGDKIVIYYNQDKYLYEIDNIKIVLPEDIEVLKQTTDDRLTLITCTPVGTNLKRLIVSAKLIARNGQEIKAGS